MTTVTDLFFFYKKYKGIAVFMKGCWIRRVFDMRPDIMWSRHHYKMLIKGEGKKGGIIVKSCRDKRLQILLSGTQKKTALQPFAF